MLRVFQVVHVGRQEAAGRRHRAPGVVGRRLRVLTLFDIYARESLAIEVDKGVAGEESPISFGVSLPEGAHPCVFVSNALDRWAYENGVKLDFSRPGKPIDNTYVESFNGRLREECLNVRWFLSLDDARNKIEAWRRFYNESRPHTVLGGKTPNEFALSAGLRPAS